MYLGDGLHDLYIWTLFDQSDKNSANESLPHFCTHHNNSALHKIQAQDQQFTGHWNRKNTLTNLLQFPTQTMVKCTHAVVLCREHHDITDP